MGFFTFSRRQPNNRLIAEADLTELLDQYMPPEMMQKEMARRVIMMIDEMAQEVVKAKRLELIEAISKDARDSYFAKLAMTEEKS